MDAGIGQFIPLVLIFVIFYFFLIRPQQKKVKDHKAMVEALKRGDKVITSGGIVGTVERIIDNEKVEVQISDNVNVEVVRATGIQGLVSSTEPKKITL
ncbi:preprotein translocase subunit YajC [Candidatus Pelagibacter sp.]|nr:preprotein translocase subunit YajC [Candidatus Pelagibacter sp.]